MLVDKRFSCLKVCGLSLVRVTGVRFFVSQYCFEENSEVGVYGMC